MRYPKATWVPSPNTGGPMGPIRLGVLHVMEGSISSCDAWFGEVASQVSAHFGISKTGLVHQYIDTDTIAWAEAQYNDVAISIEHEGNSGDALTPLQAQAGLELISWLKSVHGIPTVRTSDPNGRGWIGHGELGALGGNHPDCPGRPILDGYAFFFNLKPGPPAPSPRRETVSSVAVKPDGTVVSTFVGEDSHAYLFETSPDSSHTAWLDLSAQVGGETGGKDVPLVQA